MGKYYAEELRNINQWIREYVKYNEVYCLEILRANRNKILTKLAKA